MKLGTILCLFLCAFLTISQQKVTYAEHHHNSHRRGHEIERNEKSDGYLSTYTERLIATYEQLLSEAHNNDATFVHSHHNKRSHRGGRRHVLPNITGKSEPQQSSGGALQLLKFFNVAGGQSVTSNVVGTNPISNQQGVQALKYSILSQAAYAGFWTIRSAIGITNFLRSNTQNYPLVTQELNGYKMVKARSTHYAIANDQKKELIVAFRGTLFYSPFDWVNDFMIALNMRPYRWMRGYLFTRWMMYKHPGYSVKLVGHSLGGTMAEAIGEALNGQAQVYSFNPGQCPITDKRRTYSYITAYKMDGDVISQCRSMAQNLIIFPHENRGYLDRHSIQVFRDLYHQNKLKDKF